MRKVFKHALVDGQHRLPFYAFVIVVVPAVQVDAVDFAARGVEHHGKEIGQHLGADALGKGLPFALVLLPMAFDPVPENLVEEDARCAPGEDRRPHERLGLRRFEELGCVVGHAVNRRQQRLVVGKTVRVDCLEGLEGLQVGAVGGFGGGGNHHARESAAVHQAAASVLTKYLVSVCAETETCDVSTLG
jgi:hypothetical protein